MRDVQMIWAVIVDHRLFYEFVYIYLIDLREESEYNQQEITDRPVGRKS